MFHSRALALPFVAAVLTCMYAAATPHVAHADCGSVGVTTCVDGLSRELMQRRVDRTLATDPANERIDKRFNQTGPAEAQPFAIAPDGKNTNFNTSLTQWGSAITGAEKARLEKAREELTKKKIKLPREITAANPKLDVWARAHHTPFEADDRKVGDALTTYVGADYKLRRDLLVGGMVQVDETERAIDPNTAGSVAGQAYMAGPYMAYRVTPGITLDAKTAIGVAEDSAVADTGSADFATNRMLSEARVTSNVAIDKWTLSQKGAVTYIDERSSASVPGVAGTAVDATRLSVGPELKRPIDAGDGKSLEPFVFYKKSLNLDRVGGLDLSGSQDIVGGGVSLNKQNAYQIRATADFTETQAQKIDNSVAGRVQVNVPLP
jgi:hypothetical protein